jgi:hypothetical protein
VKLVFGSLCAVKRGVIFYDLTINNRGSPCVVAIIGNENDQVPKGRSVDALAHTGDEGRDTLR